MDDYLTTKEAADALSVTRQTLWNWRNEKKGPPYIKVARTVIYPRADFEAWAEANKKKGDDEHRPGA